MSIRKRVSSGTAKGAPCNSSNAWTKVAPLRTDARSAATHAAAPMVGIRGDASRFPHRSGLFCHARRIHHHKFHLHRPRRYRQPNEARSEPAHAVIAAIPPIPRSDSATARRPSTPAMRRNIPNHTHHASCAPSAHESIPTLAGTDRTAIPGASRRPCNRPSTASNLPTCAMRRLPAIRST